MKTENSPPPVHVHVPGTAPVHVYMRRSPSRTTQNRTRDAQANSDGGRSKVRTPWIPPGRLSHRRDRSRVPHQSDDEVGRRRDEEEQDEGPDAVSKNLSVLLREQESMRYSKKSDCGDRHRDTDGLLRTLVEAEIDAVAVTNQLTALKKTFDCLTKDKRPSTPRQVSLERQQALLLEKIQMFDNTNHCLRKLLRDWTEYERESLAWSEQRDEIKKRLADTEADNIRLVARLTNKEKEAVKLTKNLDLEMDNAKKTEGLSKILHSTRTHLEAQLSRTEADRADLAAQVQQVKQSHEEQQQALKALQEELVTLKRRREEEREELEREDQEALELTTQQAERAEENARQLTAKLQEKESQLAQALSTSSDWCLRHSKESAAKAQREEDVSALQLQLKEQASQRQAREENIRTEREELRDHLRHLNSENASTELHNQKLQGQLTSSEHELRDLHTEARRLKSSIKKLETLVERYKKKLQQAREEAEDSCLKLERTQKEARDMQVSLAREQEQARRELLGRRRELEALPDILRRTEEQLREAQQEADAHHRRNMEHSSALADVRHKVEQQGVQLESLQQKNLLLQEENNILKESSHKLERRLEETKAEKQELSQALILKDASVHSIQQQLEDKSLECSNVSRKLQHTVEDAQRQVDGSMQRVLAKEKETKTNALDLQDQLSRARTELNQLQRSKEEMERRFQSQLQNMKERLEQSDSTNRSLQNYVHFLKSSYGNVFGDSLVKS